MTTPAGYPEGHTALTDDNNVELRFVDEGEGFTPEGAYRFLAELPQVESVQVTPEE